MERTVTKRKKPAQRAETGRPATNDTPGVSSDVASNRKATGGITGKGFMPGQSGNPAGRPKDDPELVEAFRARTPQALATLDKVMADYASNAVTDKGDPLVPSAAAVKAAEVTLNRGWGSAPAVIRLDANVKAELQHDIKAEVVQSPERMRTIIAVLKRAGQLEESTETTEPVETKE